MEKHALRRDVGRSPGLLIRAKGLLARGRLVRGRLLAVLALLFACLGQGASAAASHAAYLRSLSFKCQDGYVFSSTNTVFAVDIAYLPPEDLSVYLNSIPNNVELVSIKKVTYIPPSGSGQGYGTHVEITVRFSSTGDVKLFAADLETKEGFFKIPFPTVHVWANMQILKPELSVSVDGNDGAGGPLRSTVGSHIGYTVRVKYASAVRSISYEIPENSIFIEKERMLDPDGAQAQASEFSPNFQDAARYDWQPLAAGEYELPPVRLVVQSYSGNLVSLPFPSIKVHVAEPGSVAADASQSGAALSGSGTALSGALEAAFAASPSVRQEDGGGGSLEDAALLAELYGKELSSLPFLNAAAEARQQLEGRLGRDVQPPLPRRPLLVLLLVLALATVLLAVAFALQKYFSRAAFALVMALLLSLSAAVYGARLSRRYAVSKGGTLYPIPESGLSQGGTLPTASVVQILKEAGDWYYVSFNDTNGWIPSDAVILIR